MTFLEGYVGLQHSSMVMPHCNVHQGLCRTMTFIKGYIGLQHSSMVMSHVTFILVDLCQIATFINGSPCAMVNNDLTRVDYVSPLLAMVNMKCYIHQWLRCIVTFIKGQPSH
jgi:hypothetical protein